jgi:glycosyltransferase involved in cell wall biosynthesis
LPAGRKPRYQYSKRGSQVSSIIEKGIWQNHLNSKLSRWLRKNPVDVIHTHLSNDLWVLVPALRLSGSEARLILSKCMESGVSKKDLFHRFLYNRVDETVAVSNFIKSNVLKTCPVTDEQITVVPDAIQLEKFSPDKYDSSAIKTTLGINPGTFVIGMIGRMTPGKGYEILFDAAAKISNSPLKDKIKFLVVGAASHGEEEYEKKLMNLVQEKNIGAIMQFCGFQSDIPKYLAAMDLLVFPSNEESFGGTVLEAMAMRVPVIASNSGGVPDIIINNETGLLVERNSLAALVDAINRLYNDKDLRETFANAGRKRVEEHFEMNKNMKLFERLYAGEI